MTLHPTQVARLIPQLDELLAPAGAEDLRGLVIPDDRDQPLRHPRLSDPLHRRPVDLALPHTPRTHADRPFGSRCPAV
ncbi:hypothetical protein [Streptomyces sp. NPDC048825]|uniref:hypothetical protein n=1 Tax=Streptomyces sp. NPDC048825 TaxID=3365592 RepID=UPI003720984B